MVMLTPELSMTQYTLVHPQFGMARTSRCSVGSTACSLPAGVRRKVTERLGIRHLRVVGTAVANHLVEAVLGVHTHSTGLVNSLSVRSLQLTASARAKAEKTSDALAVWDAGMGEHRCVG